MDQRWSVISAHTTDSFKYKLDKFWSNQDIIFDYKAELTGTPLKVMTVFSCCLLTTSIFPRRLSSVLPKFGHRKFRSGVTPLERVTLPPPNP